MCFSIDAEVSLSLVVFCMPVEILSLKQYAIYGSLPPLQYLFVPRETPKKILGKLEGIHGRVKGG